MGFNRRWKPSKAKAREFAQTMDEIRDFCDQNGIGYSHNMDSYYFILNGKTYRVSNHTIEASNAGAYNEFGVQTRELYHSTTRSDDVTYIHASKTRIRDIYNDLVAGYTLDGRGYRKGV